MTTKPLSEQTPVEIDTALYALYRDHLDLRIKREHAMTSLRHIVGDKHDYYRKTWGMDATDVLAKAQTLASTDTTYVGRDAVKGLAEYDRLTEAMKDNRYAQKPLHDEYSRRPWTRGFLVTDGHVHSSMNCSTCFPTTEFTWLVDLSGKDEAEIVELAGERACTICYPTAPTLRSFEKASPLFTEEEAERNRQREIRAQEKAERLAKKIAKGLTHDGSEFVVVTEVGTHPDDYHIERLRGQRFERRESFKTEQAAVQWVVANRASYWAEKRSETIKAAEEAIIMAIITKRVHQRIPTATRDAVEAEIAAKVAAKIKRDNRGY